MHVALHNFRQRLSLRTVLTLGATVTLVIVGLLALHTFTAESGTHTVVGAAHSAVDSGLVAAADGQGEGQIACEALCASSAENWPAHDDLLMACILAVLASFLLVVLPRPLLRRIPVVHRPPSRSVDRGARNLPVALSLVALSISRT
jgi:hypothetical protein